MILNKVSDSFRNNLAMSVIVTFSIAFILFWIGWNLGRSFA